MKSLLDLLVHDNIIFRIDIALNRPRRVLMWISLVLDSMVYLEISMEVLRLYFLCEVIFFEFYDKEIKRMLKVLISFIRLYSPDFQKNRESEIRLHLSACCQEKFLIGEKRDFEKNMLNLLKWHRLQIEIPPDL